MDNGAALAAVALVGLGVWYYQRTSAGEDQNSQAEQGGGIDWDWLGLGFPGFFGEPGDTITGGIVNDATDNSNDEVPGRYLDTTLPRGIRNNNPGNIRKSADNWQGLSPEQTDSAFFQFKTPLYGIRALAVVLRNYRDKHGLHTVRGIINRWAPPVENNTSSYVNAVASAMGVSPDAPLAWNWDMLRKLVAAIIKHENGQQPYSMELIDRALTAAGW